MQVQYCFWWSRRSDIQFFVLLEMEKILHKVVQCPITSQKTIMAMSASKSPRIIRTSFSCIYIMFNFNKRWSKFIKIGRHSRLLKLFKAIDDDPPHSIIFSISLEIWKRRWPESIKAEGIILCQWILYQTSLGNRKLFSAIATHLLSSTTSARVSCRLCKQSIEWSVSCKNSADHWTVGSQSRSQEFAKGGQEAGLEDRSPLAGSRGRAQWGPGGEAPKSWRQMDVDYTETIKIWNIPIRD